MRTVITFSIALPLIATVLSGGGQAPAPRKVPVAAGKTIYANYCIGCHQASGQGNPPLVAALGANRMLGDLRHVVQTVRQGRGLMPAFPRLDAVELAAVATYVRNSWKNDFGRVDAAEVTALLSDLEKPAPGAAGSSGGWYTEEQAARGKELYLERCAQCHGVNFVPDDFSTGLKGAAFDWRWKERTVYDLFETTRATMPPGEGGTLGPQTTIDIVSYLLQVNGLQAGPKELPPQADVLQQLRIRR